MRTNKQKKHNKRECNLKQKLERRSRRRSSSGMKGRGGKHTSTHIHTYICKVKMGAKKATQVIEWRILKQQRLQQQNQQQLRPLRTIQKRLLCEQKRQKC